MNMEKVKRESRETKKEKKRREKRKKERNSNNDAVGGLSVQNFRTPLDLPKSGNCAATVRECHSITFLSFYNF
jgi:hypothetical protein